MLFQSENYQYMEQVASQCCGGFLRQLLQETTGRLEQGCGTISDAYIHYYYKLQESAGGLAGSRTNFRGYDVWRQLWNGAGNATGTFFSFISSYHGEDRTSQGRYIARASITGTSTTSDICCVCFSTNTTTNWFKSKNETNSSLTH